MRVGVFLDHIFSHFASSGIRLVFANKQFSGAIMVPLIRSAFALSILTMVVLVLSMSASFAQHQASRVLWFNAMPDYNPEVLSRHRKQMATYADKFQDGKAFDVTYMRKLGKGELARALGAKQYDIVVLDMANQRVRLNNSDKRALQQFYASGHSGLMLDGSFAIRNINHNPRTNFPGKNGSSAALLINQLVLLAQNGGGVLIGTDHNIWQPNANAALAALVPGAVFKGTTNPSTDGDFIGSLLLGSRVSVKARDLLRHWESVPNQGEAPVGQYTDFMGRPVTLYSLVETADKPGGGRKRPYISSSFFPGDERIPIDSDKQVFDNLPTHKSKP